LTDRAKVLKIRGLAASSVDDKSIGADEAHHRQWSVYSGSPSGRNGPHRLRSRFRRSVSSKDCRLRVAYVRAFLHLCDRTGLCYSADPHGRTARGCGLCVFFGPICPQSACPPPVLLRESCFDYAPFIMKRGRQGPGKKVESAESVGGVS